MLKKVIIFCVCLCGMISMIQCTPGKTYEECISDCNEQHQKCVNNYKATHPDSGGINLWIECDNFKACYAECEKYPKKEEKASEQTSFINIIHKKVPQKRSETY